MPSLLPLLLLACHPGALDEDSAVPALELPGQACGLEPAPSAALVAVEVGAGGVWGLDADGALHRWSPAEGDGCILEGERVLGGGGTVVKDVALDLADQAWVLLGDGTLSVRTPTGAALRSCSLEPAEALALDPDGLWVATIDPGDALLQRWSIEAEGCTAQEPVPLPHPIASMAVATAGGLAVAYEDPAAALSPGALLDPTSGEVLGLLGVGLAPDGRGMSAIAELAPTNAGYWAAGSPDGELWHMDADGVLDGVHRPEALLPVRGDPDPSLNLYAIGWSGLGPSYLSAGFVELQGLWSLELEP